MTFSRAQHGAHRERVCPWDLSRDEFCGSVYFFAPTEKIAWFVLLSRGFRYAKLNVRRC